MRQMDPAILSRLMGAMMIGLDMIKTREGTASPLNKLNQDEIVRQISEFLMGGVSTGKKKQARRA